MISPDLRANKRQKGYLFCCFALNFISTGSAKIKKNKEEIITMPDPSQDWSFWIIYGLLEEFLDKNQPGNEM